MSNPQGPCMAENKQDETVSFHFRNYIPKSKALRQHVIPSPSVLEIERQLDQDMLESIAMSLKEDVLNQIAPKKPNWDLKRDIQRKLHTLSKQTNAAIVQLIRLQRQGDKTGIATRQTEKECEVEDLSTADKAAFAARAAVSNMSLVEDDSDVSDDNLDSDAV